MSAETDGCFPKHSREACQVAVTPAKSVGGEPARCTTQPSSLGSETPGPSDKSVLRLFFFSWDTFLILFTLLFPGK